MNTHNKNSFGYYLTKEEGRILIRKYKGFGDAVYNHFATIAYAIFALTFVIIGEVSSRPTLKNYAIVPICFIPWSLYFSCKYQYLRLCLDFKRKLLFGDAISRFRYDSLEFIHKKNGAQFELLVISHLLIKKKYILREMLVWQSESEDEILSITSKLLDAYKQLE